MKHFLLSGFLILSLFIPLVSSAQTEVDPNPNTSICISLQNNLHYRSKDINTNGEVSTLQDFLQSKGYLSSEPTGYFGLLTLQASKKFQNANGINGNGYVGPVTRAKIKDVSCNGDVSPILPTEPIACTMETRQCSDGSYVGRTGPSCEFANCPPVVRPVSSCTTTGYDPTTGLRCGCTSTSGYSSINGESCNFYQPVISYLQVGGCTTNIGVTSENSYCSAVSSGTTVYVFGSSFSTNAVIYIGDGRIIVTPRFISANSLSFVVPSNLGGNPTVTVKNEIAGQSYLSNVVSLPLKPVCSTSGYDSTTGFRCGCTSTSGLSSTTGLSCGQSSICEYPNPPAGYHYEGGASYPTCGARLVANTPIVIVPLPPSTYEPVLTLPPPPPSYPPGCSSASGYSSTTGVPCGGTEPAIIISSPLNGAEYHAGDNANVSWIYTALTGSELVKMYLVSASSDISNTSSTPAGSTNISLNQLTLSSGPYEWSVPSGISNGIYRIIIDVTKNGSVIRGHSNTFTLSGSVLGAYTNLPSGCYAGANYSVTTGQSCNISNFPSGCSSYSGYSTTTGKVCAI